ncbi:MAG: DMT family transporter [Candidatus Riflebacteria bacterium]|nr:DMT family transporter [Candidatus Riflebacteria bacterium]MDD3376587.1 DMT family transporter [Candidatus Riflebacteria bacterium]NCB46602.1 hypothetical protein [bacterium]
MNNKAAILMVAACGMLRSTDLFFRNPALAAVPLLVLIFWEHLINLIVLTPIAFKSRSEFSKIKPKDTLLFILVGFGASAMGLICFSAAFKYINPAIVVILQKMQPIITVTLGALVIKEKVTAKFIIWALLSILCVCIISLDLSAPLSIEGLKFAKGATLALLAAFFWGGGTVWGKILLGKFSQTLVIFVRFFLGTIFALSLALIFHKTLSLEILFGEKMLIGSVVYMALISGTIAVSFFYAGLKKVNASLTGILELFFPVFSVIIMWVFFNKPLATYQILAATVMFYASYRATLETHLDNNTKGTL